MYRILLVDDEENVLNALRRLLTSHPSYTVDDHRIVVETFSQPAEALKRAEAQAFDAVISDYRMPEMNGVEFLRAFRRLQPNAARLILSGYADLSGLIGAINEAQIFRFIAKPWHEYDIQSSVAQALAHRNLLLENQRLADLVRVQEGKLSRQEMALRRLEEESPGITKVNWGPDGSVLLEEDDDTR